MTPTQRKVLRWTLGAVAGVLTIFVISTIVIAYGLRESVLKPRFVNALSEALNCDVSLKSISVKPGALLSVVGEGLSIRLKNRPELPDFIAADRFSVSISLWAIVKRRVGIVDVDGLKFNVPKQVGDAIRSGDATNQQQNTQSGTATPPPPDKPRRLYSIEHVLAHDGTLNFVGRTPNDRPLKFLIHDLDIKDASVDRPMNVVMHVTNPFPEGLVTAIGTIGPWNRDEPVQTPLQGTYDLPDGNLSSIAGISGHASSKGQFTGQLTEIKVKGTSHTNNFSFEIGGKPVEVSMDFDVSIHGNNGDVIMERVDAMLIKTPIHFTGSITNPPTDGHDVKITVDAQNGRIEDVLPLIINSPTPILLGDIALKGVLFLPAGNADTIKRLQVNGSFQINHAVFQDPKMQETLRDLSLRAQGRDREERVQPIATAVKGTIAAKNGTARMSGVVVKMPGAQLDLSGTYVVGPEDLNFMGTVRLEASLSKVIGGFKGMLLKPFNGLFRDGKSGAIIPIQITGKRPDPQIGIRKGDIFKKGK